MDKTITSMSTTTLLGTRDDDGFSRDGCTEFTGKYRCRSCLRKRGLLQAQRDDRVHYALAYLPIEIFCVRFELDRRKKNRLSNHDRDWHKMQTAAATRQSFVCPKDPHWHHGSERFCDHQSQSRLSSLQITIERPRAFRKNQRCVSRFQNTNQSLEGASVDPFLINRDNVQLRYKPAEQQHFRQRSARQKVH